MKIFLVITGILVGGSVLYGLWVGVLWPKILKMLEIDPDLDEKTKNRIRNLQFWIIVLGIIVISIVLKNWFGIELFEDNEKSLYLDGPI
jgi:quinol-cytochrome oxidoreductase complex cytochrome b subunit